MHKEPRDLKGPTPSCPHNTNIIKVQKAQNKLIPKHLPGRLNVLADTASRSSPTHGEWAMDANTFSLLWRSYGPFQIDLFANRYNAQILPFISPYPDPLAAGENAFSLDWNQWDSLYVFPPTKVLPLVVQRLHLFRGQGILIAPYHPGSSWFPSLKVRCPLHAPLPPSLRLSQTITAGTVFHPNSHAFILHAWRL